MDPHKPIYEHKRMVILVNIYELLVSLAFMVIDHLFNPLQLKLFPLVF